MSGIMAILLIIIIQPLQLALAKRGSWRALYRNTVAFMKFFKALIFSPSSRLKDRLPEASDKHSDFPTYGCR